MKQFWQKLISVLMVSSLGISILSGCSHESNIGGTEGSTSVEVEEESAEASPAVMDFNADLNLKKPNQPVKKDPEIMFVGNSFIFYNDVIDHFYYLSESGGFSPALYDYTEGSYTFEMFADPDDELGAQVYDALTNYEFDYVILQEQSRMPTLYSENSMYPAARILDDLVKQANAQTIFYMTWAYKNGDDLREYGIPKVTTREEMQTQLANSYITIADELDAFLSPIGIAFMRCAEQYPEIELWDEDLRHASKYGAYLAACTLYGTIYDESPVGLDYISEFANGDALHLQEIASSVVFGNKSLENR